MKVIQSYIDKEVPIDYTNKKDMKIPMSYR